MLQDKLSFEQWYRKILFLVKYQLYLDANNEQIHVFAEGEGTAAELSYVFYNDAYWIVIKDVTHAGRKMYILNRYNGADCIADSFDSMKYPRVYKDQLTNSEIKEELIK